MTQALIELSDLSFSWPGHPVLLDIPAFRLEPGETLFLKGPSGSGKTTLLGLLGGVQKANSGTIRLLGQELGELGSGARDRFRVDHTGYIFQQFNLLPFLSVRENVELPCHFSRLRASRAVQRHGSVDNAAQTLGTQYSLNTRLGELATGEYSNRVAVSSNDEVGQLARDFNQLAYTLSATKKCAANLWPMSPTNCARP